MVGPRWTTVVALGALLGAPSGCEAPAARAESEEPPLAAAPPDGPREPTLWIAENEWTAAERTAGATRRRLPAVKRLFADAKVTFPPKQLLLRAFKLEDELEVWASSRADGPLTLVATYAICRASGGVGPKRREGDKQVPEGFYDVDFFHDHSRFHLAMRVSYPNASDRVLSDRSKPGGDIMIHGRCRSIGCLAMSDERIEELWVMARGFAEAGKRREVPVHILPTRKMSELLADGDRPEHHAFWRNLLEGYQLFERRRVLPKVTVAPDGRYRFTAGE